MKSRPLIVCLLCVAPAVLFAQNLDFNAVRSAEQLRSGVQSFHRGYFNQAWTSLEKAISYQPANSLAQIWLGRAQMMAGYEQEALRTWQQVVDANKGSALIRDWINVLTFRRGLGRELSSNQTMAVSTSLDGNLPDGHPFKRPTSVRSRPDGSFWVVAFGSNEVLRFDASFRLLDTFRGGFAGFDRPYDVVEDSDGTFFVSEYGANRIAKCNARGEKIATFGNTGKADGLLLGPQYMTADSRGTLWVTDWGHSRVVRYDRNGTFIQTITGIQGPTGIAAFENKLYVAEKSGKRILVYDLNGNRLGTEGEGTLDQPEGMAFTVSGKLLVADANRIMECDLENDSWVVRSDTSPFTKRLVQQAVTQNGDILGVDFDQNRVVLLSDVSALYAGLVVRVVRVNANSFPTVFADVTVENKLGSPVVGLNANNFIATESHAAVGSPSLALTNSDPVSNDVALLVERSPDIDANRADLEQAVADAYGAVTPRGRIKAVSAGAQPVREADFGETRLRFGRQALQAAPTPKWRFDLGVRLAGDELITGVTGAKKSIIYLSSGLLPAAAFSTYSLLELAAYLKNNDVAFFPVIVGNATPDEELSFLASETGGTLSFASAPGGMKDVLGNVQARLTSLYTLRFKSLTPPQFGDKYIPLEIEVTSQKVSGRDESGYYAPATTGSGAAGGQ